MKLEELRAIVHTLEPAAVVVAPKVITKVLQQEYKLPFVMLEPPHSQGFVLDRAVLFRHVDEDELELDRDRLLPQRVLLLSALPAEDLLAMGRNAVLLHYWRLLFHLRVHVALQQQRESGILTDAAIRQRIEQIGRTEFEEIRTVLQQENLLLRPNDDFEVYCEFVAEYLELRQFSPHLRETYFPAILDFNRLDKFLAEDLNGQHLFEQTRLEGAPEPILRNDMTADESQDFFWKLMRQADRSRRENDLVRAAILHTRAARVAPAALTATTLLEAQRDLELLVDRMRRALEFNQAQAIHWLQGLPAVLDKADQGQNPVEARLLHNLQQACEAFERRSYTVDVAEWLISAGKRPLIRPLPSLEVVRLVSHLRSALNALTTARVSDEARQQLGQLLEDSLEIGENRLRSRFRPILVNSFRDVGLVANNPPEKVALHKMIEELLDHISEYGFLTFSDLRDTVSRNQLKLPDLTDPLTFSRGDALMQLDRRLATQMDGVYRRAEFYLRWLERFGSLSFGTPLGRVISKFLILPFGSSFLMMHGLELTLVHYWNKWHGEHQTFYPNISSLILGLVLLFLTCYAPVRQFLSLTFQGIYRSIGLLWELPRRLLPIRFLRNILRSWPLLLFYWYIFKPTLVTCLLWLVFPTLSAGWWAVLTFLSVAILVNQPFWFFITEAAIEILALIYLRIRVDLFVGLYRWIVQSFKRLTDTVEAMLHRVDEMLRFKNRENRLAIYIRAVSGVLWYPIGNLIRLYFIVLVEPNINPVKLTITFVAFKFLLPLYELIHLRELGLGYLKPFLGTIGANIVFWPTYWLSAGVFGFLFWEIKENWKLYRANRSQRLRPVVIGHHGETMLQLLKPGFHSGTIPQLYSQLRQAERQAFKTSSWRSVRTYRRTLETVKYAVRQFIEREFIVLLHQSKTWPNHGVSTGRIVLAVHCLRIELLHAQFEDPQESIWLEFEQRAGWIIGTLPENGWLRHLTNAQQQVFRAALWGLFKIAGVDFIRQQLHTLLSPHFDSYDLTARHLILWRHGNPFPEVRYELLTQEAYLKPRLLKSRPAAFNTPNGKEDPTWKVDPSIAGLGHTGNILPDSSPADPNSLVEPTPLRHRNATPMSTPSSAPFQDSRMSDCKESAIVAVVRVEDKGKPPILATRELFFSKLQFTWTGWVRWWEMESISGQLAQRTDEQLELPLFPAWSVAPALPGQPLYPANSELADDAAAGRTNPQNSKDSNSTKLKPNDDATSDSPTFFQ